MNCVGSQRHSKKKNRAKYAVSNRKENSGFRRIVDEVFALLDCNVMYFDSSLPNFQGSPSVSYSLVMGLREH